MWPGAEILDKEFNVGLEWMQPNVTELRMILIV